MVMQYMNETTHFQLDEAKKRLKMLEDVAHVVDFSRFFKLCHNFKVNNFEQKLFAIPSNSLCRGWNLTHMVGARWGLVIWMCRIPQMASFGSNGTNSKQASALHDLWCWTHFIKCFWYISMRLIHWCMMETVQRSRAEHIPRQTRRSKITTPKTHFGWPSEHLSHKRSVCAPPCQRNRPQTSANYWNCWFVHGMSAETWFVLFEVDFRTVRIVGFKSLQFATRLIPTTNLFKPTFSTHFANISPWPSLHR
jgi:hypothetical protein